ncbi:MAG: hypothetical protein BM557_03955 [Flavobacterium sp. MedPE-SWcel]|uniref:hypothetical protein n=1 Tax=uncultured Flavobacterium sp. TaxID=165435 RepID=UPI000916BB6F|nr:hypothetical protein [uncultured Flavobacterium sp.]OIQ21415.1 MAG: hypothetical protein BM557_03955 [Flavobacterium sp. MedPE-SWcel]
MKKYITLTLLFVGICSFAQSSQNENITSVKLTEAYKQKAIDKVLEFYNYIELLTDPALNSKMKEHTANEALKLFITPQTAIHNFFNKTKTNPSISALLKNATHQKKQYHFTLTTITATPQYQNPEQEEWIVTYSLTINNSKGILLKQNFIIKVENKKFGNSIKKVKNTYLGEIIVL